MFYKFANVIIFISVSFSLSSFDRNISTDIGGFKAFCFSIEASVSEPPDGIGWLELRRFYGFGVRCAVRDYRKDSYGSYASALVYGSLGRLDLIKNSIGFDIIAGAHYSSIRKGYEYTDLLGGFRVDLSLVFWREHRLFGLSGAMLTDGDALVSWGEIDLKPHNIFRLGGGFQYDENLSRWGDPVPFIDDPDAQNKYKYGMNYFLFIGLNFAL